MMRDFYWRRSGWHWIVGTVEQQNDSCNWGVETILCHTWREKTAAKITILLFDAYLQGQEIQRRRMAPPPADRTDVENIGSSQS